MDRARIVIDPKPQVIPAPLAPWWEMDALQLFRLRSVAISINRPWVGYAPALERVTDG